MDGPDDCTDCADIRADVGADVSGGCTRSGSADVGAGCTDAPTYIESLSHKAH